MFFFKGIKTKTRRRIRKYANRTHISVLLRGLKLEGVQEDMQIAHRLHRYNVLLKFYRVKVIKFRISKKK